MKRTGMATVLVALLVVLAGCAGGAGTLTDSPQSSDATETTSSSSSPSSDTGTVNFYVSDEANAIEDFEHLNVTIERVTFVRADGDDDSDDDAVPDGDETESDDDAVVEASANTSTNASANVSNDTTVDATANATATVSVENETDADAESESDAEGQTTYEVENVTVDLTELKGDNATLVGGYDVPKGEYNAVHIEVSEVSGTLKSGEEVNLKLPSNKLKLNSGFTIENGESVDFVFDITAFEAGQSGKYILKPVISESGTDVPIKNVDEAADDAEEEKEEAEDEKDEQEDEAESSESESEQKAEKAEADSDASAELNVTFDGNVTTDENVTLTVTRNGSAVENATVAVNDEVVGSTDANGTLVVDIPDAEEIDVKVTHGDAEAEFEFELVAEVTATTEDGPENPGNSEKSDNDDA